MIIIMDLKIETVFVWQLEAGLEVIVKIHGTTWSKLLFATLVSALLIVNYMDKMEDTVRKTSVSASNKF